MIIFPGILQRFDQLWLHMSWPQHVKESSTLLALFKFRSPSKFSVTLLCQQPPRQKFRLKTFTWRNRIFNIAVIDREKASRKILSYTHRRRLKSMSKPFSESTICLQYIWESQFRRCQYFRHSFFCNLANMVPQRRRARCAKKQKCVDTTLQVSFKHLSAWAQISYGTLTKHQTWRK